MTTASLPVQRQLDAYNAHDLEAFCAEYAEDVQLFSPPSTQALIVGKAALAAHYSTQRFSLPHLHAELVHRIVMGNIVVDHERITGLRTEAFDAVVVFEVNGLLITRVWVFNPA